MGFYPVLQLPQLVEGHPAHPEEAEDVVVLTSPPGPVDLETNPQADMSLAKSLLSQTGQLGASFPKTKVSKSLPQALHLYSYIGMGMTSQCFGSYQ